MTEVVGAVAASIQLLDRAIDIFKALKRAYEKQKGLAILLDKYREELKGIKRTVQNVQNEPALRTPDIAATLDRLKGSEHRLDKWLNKVDPGDKSSTRQFANQLVKGSHDRKKLEEIMAELTSVQSELCRNIAIRQAQMTRRLEKGVNANKEEIRKVMDKLNKNHSEVVGVKKTKPFQSRYQDPVDLNDSGISSMDGEDDRSIDGQESVHRLLTKPLEVFQKRIITDNLSEEDSLMLNAPVGPDVWKNERHLEIRGNTSRGRSFMLNYPNSRETIEWLMDRQASREEKARQRQNGRP